MSHVTDVVAVANVGKLTVEMSANRAPQVTEGRGFGDRGVATQFGLHPKLVSSFNNTNSTF